MKRYIIPLVVFVALAVALGVGLTLNPSLVPSPLIGKAAPAFRASELYDPGRTVTVADLRGRVVAVNVWASWCTACLDEHPIVTELSKALPIYGLNYRDRREKAKQWLHDFGNPFQAVMFDPKGRIGMDWGVYGVPETYILDASGTIRYKHIGAITQQVLDKDILPRVRALQGETRS